MVSIMRSDSAIGGGNVELKDLETVLLGVQRNAA